MLINVLRKILEGLKKTMHQLNFECKYPVTPHHPQYPANEIYFLHKLFVKGHFLKKPRLDEYDEKETLSQSGL